MSLFLFLVFLETKFGKGTSCFECFPESSVGFLSSDLDRFHFVLCLGLSLIEKTRINYYVLVKDIGVSVLSISLHFSISVF